MSKRAVRLGITVLVLCLVGVGIWRYSKQSSVALANPWDEHAELVKFQGDFVKAGKPSMRVLVQLDGAIGKPGERYTAPRSDAERAQRAQSIAKAQGQFLTAVKPNAVRAARRLSTIPFLSMEIDGADLTRIAQFVTDVPVTADGARTFRVRIEPDRTVEHQAVAAAQTAKLPDVLTRIGWPTLTQSGDAPLVAVIDSRITETKVLPLQGRIVDRKAYALGFPNASAAEPAYDSSIDVNHGTGVASVIALCDSWPGILALRCDEADGVIWTSNMIAALVDVDATWKPLFGNRLGVVSMSLGDPSCFSDSECSCWPVTTEAMTAALLDLDARDIAVVLPAGNRGSLVPGVIFPACFAGAITVGSTFADSATVAGTSCWSNQLDLCAPGQGIVIEYTDPSTGRSATKTLSGTSIAVPFVASAIAVLRASHPESPLQGILDALKSSGFGIAPASSARNPEPATIPEIRVAAAHLSLSS